MRLKDAFNFWSSDSSKEFGGPLKFDFVEIATKMHGELPSGQTLTDDLLFDVVRGEEYPLEVLKEDIYKFVRHVQR